jgi:hypothetical protein
VLAARNELIHTLPSRSIVCNLQTREVAETTAKGGGLCAENLPDALLCLRIPSYRHVRTNSMCVHMHEHTHTHIHTHTGESLVSGEVSGSAIAFKANKAALDKPEVLHYASKSEGMFVGESLIFRSDSNGEDLEGYAGVCVCVFVCACVCIGVCVSACL